MSKLDKLLVGKPSASYFRIILAKVESNDHKIVKKKPKEAQSFYKDVCST